MVALTGKPRATSTPISPPPRVWLLLSDKQGDNAQVEVIAPALGWPCERKTVLMLPQWIRGKPRVKPSLHHLDLERSDPLEPPWPDLIITIGRRPSMAALWVQEQSGGRTKLVLVGKPSGMMERFDLVVAGAEAQLPPLANVLAIDLPLMRVDEAAVAAAAEAWRPRLADLPRPLIAFLVGGPTGPFVFDQAATGRLIALAADVTKLGGTAYVTTSRRTPAEVVERLETELPGSARLFRWAADATDNPYLGLLGLADGFVVTGDSVSMMVEIARLGRPLAILDLPQGRLGALDQTRRTLTRHLFEPASDPTHPGLRQRVAATVHRVGLLTHTRDFRAFHHMLVDRGLAVWAGQPLRPPTGPAGDDLSLVVSRIRSLFDPAAAF
jgi:mitochondrial fission protein ELM1